MCVCVYGTYAHICMHIGSIVRNLRILYVEDITSKENVVYLGKAGVIERLSLKINEVGGGVFYI